MCSKSVTKREELPGRKLSVLHVASAPSFPEIPHLSLWGGEGCLSLPSGSFLELGTADHSGLHRGLSVCGYAWEQSDRGAEMGGILGCQSPFPATSTLLGDSGGQQARALFAQRTAGWKRLPVKEI